MAEFTKDPLASIDYTFDWSAYLGTDTIASSSWVVPLGITSLSQSNTATSATIRLSGGTTGFTYSLENIITMASGQIDSRIFAVIIGPI